MKTDKHCGINDALGGGIFKCDRPVSPEGNGKYCSYHGKQDARTLRVQLTWRAWLRKWFVYFPRNTWYKVRWDLRRWWLTRNNPYCKVKDCGRRSIATDPFTQLPVCWEHYGDYE